MAIVVKKYRTVIDGDPYETEDFPASEAVDLGIELASLIPGEELQLIVQIVTASLGDDESQALAREVVAESGELLTSAMHRALASARDRPGGASALLKRLLSRTTTTRLVLLTSDAPVSGNVGAAFDTHFRGRLGHMRRVVQWLWVTLFLVPLLGDAFATFRGDRGQADPTKE